MPITGGNVSLYNETDGGAIYPTPVIGVVGLLEDAAQVLRSSFRAAGDIVYLLGTAPRGDLGGSEYLKTVHGARRGPAAAARPGRREAPARRRARRAPKPGCCSPPTT